MERVQGGQIYHTLMKLKHLLTSTLKSRIIKSIKLYFFSKSWKKYCVRKIHKLPFEPLHQMNDKNRIKSSRNFCIGELGGKLPSQCVPTPPPLRQYFSSSREAVLDLHVAEILSFDSSTTFVCFAEPCWWCFDFIHNLIIRFYYSDFFSFCQLIKNVCFQTEL